MVRLTLFLLLAFLAAARVSGFDSVNQGEPGTGIIRIDGKDTAGQALNIAVDIHVRSVTRDVNLAVSVAAMSTITFSELSPDEYVIQVSSSGYAAAQLKINVAAGQVVNISAEVTPGSSPSLGLRLNPSPGSESATFSPEAVSLADSRVIATRASDLPSCPLQEVLGRASKRLEEFVENVNRITATEVLEHQRLNKNGKILEKERHQFNYVAVIEEVGPGALNVDEYRDGAVGANAGFPHDIASVGMPSLAMIFHPYHLTEFEMSCQRRGVWQEHSVWLVDFRQRKDRPARISSLRSGFKAFPVLLKGTAWIDTENYQILHLETDLLEPILQAKLLTEHQALDYGPVQFADRKISMWLPLQAEIYLDSGGRRFRHRHTYSRYQVFSVDVGQKIGSPK